MSDLLGIDFVTEPDCIGLGRVIVGGRYYGLPMKAVIEFQKMRLGFQKLLNATDTEMGDGDLAREIARDILMPNI